MSETLMNAALILFIILASIKIAGTVASVIIKIIEIFK